MQYTHPNPYFIIVNRSRQAVRPKADVIPGSYLPVRNWLVPVSHSLHSSCCPGSATCLSSLIKWTDISSDTLTRMTTVRCGWRTKDNLSNGGYWVMGIDTEGQILVDNDASVLNIAWVFQVFPSVKFTFYCNMGIYELSSFYVLLKMKQALKRCIGKRAKLVWGYLSVEHMLLTFGMGNLVALV